MSTPAANDRVPKRERNWDAYAAIIASFVALLALLVGAYTAYLQRTQLRAQVWPMVAIGQSTVDRNVVAMSRGMGPARIKAVKVEVDGRTARTWAEVFKAIGHETRGRFTYGHVHGRILRPGEKIEADGRPIRTWDELFTAIGHKRREGFTYSHIGSRVLTAGEQLTILAADDNDASREMFDDFLEQEKHTVALLACFCSVLDDCWLTPYRWRKPIDLDQKLDRCPIADNERFLN